MPALKLRFCLFALKAGRNTAQRGGVERKAERQIVAHGNELQQQIHQILIAGAGRFVGRKFDVLPSGQMIDLTVKDILLEPALLVVEKLAGIAVHCAGSRSRADAVRKHGESGSELGLALGQLDHLVEITKLRAGGIQFGDAAIHVHQHGVEVVDELRSWNVHRIHILAGRHPAPKYAIAYFRAVFADHHAAYIVLAHDVLIDSSDAVAFHRLNGKR